MFANLFGKSPFIPLQEHMKKVSSCVHMLRPLFEAVEKQEVEVVLSLAKHISDLEHDADLAKNDIRNHLKGLLLAMDRGRFLEILSLQDSIADVAEDVGVLVSLKPVSLLEGSKALFWQFLNKNIDAFEAVFLIIEEIRGLVETSFGGLEAEKVKSMVHEVALREHEADLIQRPLLQSFFKADQEFSNSTFYLWMKILENIGKIANLSENLSNRIRMTLELN